MMDLDETEETEAEDKDVLTRLLLSRPVLAPYEGPSLEELNRTALKLVTKSQDLSYLMSECPEEEIDPALLVGHVKAQMLFRPSLSGFTLLEVLETLISQKVSACLESEDRPGLLRLARLVLKLGAEVGLDMRGVMEGRRGVRKEVTSAEVSWALHSSGLVSLDTQWKYLSTAGVKFYICDILQQSQQDREVGAGIVKAGLALVYPDNLTARNLTRSLLLHIRDCEAENEWRLDWLECRDRKWAQYGLETVLSQQERGDITEAVRSHRAWHTATHTGCGSMILALVRSYGEASSVYRLVRRAVTSSERFHWRHLLLVVSVCVEEFPTSGQQWGHQLREMLGTAVAEEDSEMLQGTLLLARRSAVSKQFLCYGSWLSESLSEESPLITGTSKRGLAFIVSSLADLVPHQSVDMLRDQLEVKATGLVRAVGEQWKDYEALLRSRRMELAGGQVTINVQSLKEEDYSQARSFIQDFAKLKRIPQKLSEITNFKKPLFDRQVAPALLTVELSDELERSRAALLVSLTDRNKLAPHLLQKYKTGQLRDKSRQDNSSEESIESLLGLLVVLGPADSKEIKQVCKRLSSAIVTFLEPFECDVSLANIIKKDNDNLSEDTLPNRVFSKVFSKIADGRNFSRDILSLLTCSSSMTRQAVKYLLEHSQRHDIDLPLTQLLVDSGKDQLEVEEGKRIGLLEVFCSRYNTVNEDEQLKMVENILTNISPDPPGVKGKYLENRRQMISGRDSLHDLRSLTELSAALETELSIKIAGQDKTPLLQSLLVTFDLADAGVKEVARLLERLVLVSQSTESQAGLRTVVQLLAGRVKGGCWGQVYRRVPDRHSQPWLSVWLQLPGIVLSAEDLQLLVKEKREDRRLCLSLEVTRFLQQTVTSAALMRCPVASLSVLYWAARRHLPPPHSDWPRTDRSLLAWRDGSHPSCVRLAVVMLAEQYLSQPISLPAQLSSHPVTARLRTLEARHSAASLEEQFTACPSLWWRGMSDQLLLSCQLLLLQLYTSGVLSPSISFTINTLLQLLSRLMDCQLDCIQDCDINKVLDKTVALILSQPGKQVSHLLRNIKFNINSDVKDLLTPVFT